MGKFYAVKVGKEGPKIYSTWDECKSNVAGFSGAIYKSFPTRGEAENFALEKKESVASSSKTDSVAEIKEESGNIFYTDGSFREGKGGYGVVHNGKGRFGPAGPSNNQAELEGVIRACKWVKSLGLKEIEIRLDSEYVQKTITVWMVSWRKKFGNNPENWKTASGQPVANLDLLLKLEKLLQQLDVNFIHVAAHVGIPGNEEADRLANEGRTADGHYEIEL
jgi:ribonuclease HI